MADNKVRKIISSLIEIAIFTIWMPLCCTSVGIASIIIYREAIIALVNADSSELGKLMLTISILVSTLTVIAIIYYLAIKLSKKVDQWLIK